MDTIGRRGFLAGGAGIGAALLAGRGTAGEAEMREALEAALAPHVAAGGMPGLAALVARGDEVAVVTLGAMDFGDAPPVQRDSIFRVASITKPVAAAVAMLLVEEGVFALDEPVDRLLPEFAALRVLRAIDSALDDTVPAARPILVEDLLTQKMGTGAVFAMEPPPIALAMLEAGVAAGPHLPEFPDTDSYAAALAALPLVRQPGEGWLYDTPMQLLGVLIERAAGAPLAEVFRARLFDPLGMTDTGFHVPEGDLERLPACYWRDHATGVFGVFDAAGAASRFARPPGFASAAGGLVTTLDDYLAFARMMRDGGVHAGRQVLRAEAVAAMTTNRVAPSQAAASIWVPGFWERRGWGYGLSTVLQAEADEPTGFGWDGGYGTSAYWDPETGLIGILFTQRLMESPDAPPVFRDFWRVARAAS